MKEKQYRPWGLLPWVLQRGSIHQWGLLGCFGTEERSLACWRTLKTAGRLGSHLLIRADDPPSQFDTQIDRRLKERRSEWEAGGGKIENVRIHPVGESIGKLINDIRPFLNSVGGSLIFDITSMPKRMFFPLLKIILKDPRVANLVVTYTIPASYPNESIAADFQDWQPLPLFSGSSSSDWHPDVMVVGVGFMAMRLREEINPERQLPVKLMFPFPPGPPSFQRSWDMVRVLEEAQERQRMEICRVSARDASDTFDHLLMMTDGGRRAATLAPFGPKPMSLAMCLYACETNSPVYYTQPRAYHPDYSLGISHAGGVPEVYGYYVRMKGVDLYKVN